jgi:hypothetical protein
MSNQFDDGQQGAFAFRYLLMADGRLTVWYRFDDHPEIGPVELNAPEADELGTLIETAARIVSRAYPSSLPSERPEDEPAQAPRTNTDPYVLRRKRPCDDDP